MNKENQLKELLNKPEYVIIEVCNVKVSTGTTSLTKITLVSGILENDELIAKLRNALCS